MSNGRQDLSPRFDNDIDERFIGRRDMLVGLWAGEQLGLPEDGRIMYALEVMAAGMMDPEPNGVVDKIEHDFIERGLSITRGQILAQFSKSHRRSPRA
jgi:hypothetical protein